MPRAGRGALSPLFAAVELPDATRNEEEGHMRKRIDAATQNAMLHPGPASVQAMEAQAHAYTSASAPDAAPCGGGWQSGKSCRPDALVMDLLIVLLATLLILPLVCLTCKKVC